MSLLMLASRKIVAEDAGILLTVSRQDGGSGTTLVSNGVWLEEGRLDPADINNVSLWINENEVSCYVEDLAINHADGSVRSLLVQWTGDPASVSSCVLRFTASSVSRATKTTCPRAPSAYFVASAAHLCEAIGAPWKMIPVGSSSLPAYLSQFDAYFETRWNFQYVTHSKTVAYIDGSTAWYSQLASMVQYGARKADAFWWHRACLLAGVNGPVAGFDTFYERFMGQTSSFGDEYNCYEDWTFLYLLTGSAEYKDAILKSAQSGGDRLAGSIQGDKTTYWVGTGNNRRDGRALGALACGLKAGVTFTGTHFNQVSYGITKDLAGLKELTRRQVWQQTADGRWGGTQYTETAAPNRIGQKAFMVGMLNRALVELDALYPSEWGALPTPINTLLDRSADWTNTNDWDAVNVQYAYGTYDSFGNGFNGDALPNTTILIWADLHHLVVCSQAYHLTINANAPRAAIVKAAVEKSWTNANTVPGGDSGGWFQEIAAYGLKAFDQTYWNFWQTQYYLVAAGVT